MTSTTPVKFSAIALSLSLLGLLYIPAVFSAPSAAHHTTAAPKVVKGPKNPPFAEVEIPAADQLVLYGRLYDPSQKGDDTPEPEDMPKGKYPLVILMHGLGDSGADWSTLPYYLVKAGYAVLALDVRGHGRSIKTTRGKRLTWRAFNSDKWKAIPRDIDRILRFFRESEDYPEVNAKQVALVGSQMGATAAMIAGSGINSYAPGTVKAVVMIDASQQFRSLNAAEAAISFKEPLFVAASQTNPETFAESQKLYRWALGQKVLKLYKNVGDGAMLIKNQPDLQMAISQWLQKYYPPSGQAPKPKAAPAPAKPKHS